MTLPPRRRLVIALAAALLAAGPVLAADKPAPKSAPAPTPAAAPADPLWGKNCEANAQGKRNCYVFQAVLHEPDKTRLLQVLIGYLGDDGKPVMIVTTPLGILLPAGLTLKIDDQPPATQAFQTCDGNGCRVVFNMDPAVLDKFAQAKAGAVRYLTLDQKPIDVPIRFEGLTQALKTLR